MTAVLSFVPVTVVLRARLETCMFRALGPMNVFSASHFPDSIPSSGPIQSKTNPVIQTSV